MMFFLLNINFDTPVTKIIVDTVRATSKDSMDLLTRMDNFYNNAWTKLILVITIAFGVIGVVMPVLIQWYQKKELKLSEEKLKAEIKSEIQKSIEAIEAAVNERSQKQLKQLRTEIKGLGHHLQGVMSKTSENYPDAFINFLKAFRAHLEAGDIKNAKAASIGIKNCLSKCSKNVVNKELARINTTFEKVINSLVSIDKNEEFGEAISEFKNIYETLL